MGSDEFKYIIDLVNGVAKIGDVEGEDSELYLEINAGTPLFTFHNGKVLVKDKVMFTQTDGNEYIDSLNSGFMDYGATTAHRFNNPLFISNIKSGSTQANAGASANELWKTSSHSTLPDNVIMIGI